MVTWTFLASRRQIWTVNIMAWTDLSQQIGAFCWRQNCGDIWSPSQLARHVTASFLIWHLTWLLEACISCKSITVDVVNGTKHLTSPSNNNLPTRIEMPHSDMMPEGVHDDNNDAVLWEANITNCHMITTCNGSDRFVCDMYIMTSEETEENDHVQVLIKLVSPPVCLELHPTERRLW